MSSSSSIKLPIILILSSLLHATLGGIICEDMPTKMCAFSISGKGKRCLLKTDNVTGENHCWTSEIDVNEFANHVESDECIAACGVDRKTIGISSEALNEVGFAAKLCSPPCYEFCPNIVDLYFNHASGEGAFLPDLCDARQANPHRPMLEITALGFASSPASSAHPSPSYASSYLASSPSCIGLDSVAK